MKKERFSSLIAVRITAYPKRMSVASIKAALAWTTVWINDGHPTRLGKKRLRYAPANCPINP